MHNRKNILVLFYLRKMIGERKLDGRAGLEPQNPRGLVPVLSFKKCLLHARDEQLREAQAGPLKC